ncbi:hypothetical protein SHIRM173S_04156 [Streptomyces hirsutus]
MPVGRHAYFVVSGPVTLQTMACRLASAGSCLVRYISVRSESAHRIERLELFPQGEIALTDARADGLLGFTSCLGLGVLTDGAFRVNLWDGTPR